MSGASSTLSKAAGNVEMATLPLSGVVTTVKAALEQVSNATDQVRTATASGMRMAELFNEAAEKAQMTISGQADRFSDFHFNVQGTMKELLKGVSDLGKEISNCMEAYSRKQTISVRHEIFSNGPRHAMPVCRRRLARDRTNFAPEATCKNTATRGTSESCHADRYLPVLLGKALVERTKIDHNSLVGSASDLLIAVACRHFEVNSSSLDVDDLGRRTDLVAQRRGGEVFYIHCSADRAFTGVQKRSNGIERGIFHDQNHHGRAATWRP